MTKIQILEDATQIECATSFTGYGRTVNHVEITTRHGTWDTRKGPTESYADHRLLALVAEYGPRSVARAIDELDVNPPLMHIADMRRIEDAIIAFRWPRRL